MKNEKSVKVNQKYLGEINAEIETKENQKIENEVFMIRNKTEFFKIEKLKEQNNQLDRRIEYLKTQVQHLTLKIQYLQSEESPIED